MSVIAETREERRKRLHRDAARRRRARLKLTPEERAAENQREAQEKAQEKFQQMNAARHRENERRRTGFLEPGVVYHGPMSVRVNIAPNIWGVWVDGDPATVEEVIAAIRELHAVVEKRSEKIRQSNAARLG